MRSQPIYLEQLHGAVGTALPLQELVDRLAADRGPDRVHDRLVRGGYVVFQHQEGACLNRAFSGEVADKKVLDAARLAAALPSTFLVLFPATTLYAVSVGLLFQFFSDADLFTGHVAWVVMKCSGLLFARLLFVWIPFVGHTERSFRR